MTRLRVNGRDHDLDVDPETPLLGYVLREAWIDENPGLARGFAAASRCARRRTSASCQASAFRRGGREGAEGGKRGGGGSVMAR